MYQDEDSNLLLVRLSPIHKYRHKVKFIGMTKRRVTLET